MNNTDNGQHFATRARVEKKNLTFFREAGRGKALVQINNVAKFNPGLILLMGEEGSGRSRVLKQYIDSLKGKTGKVCVINRAVKNENHLYAALSEGFALDLIPGESLKSIQKDVRDYLQTNTVTQKPVIIAVDDVRLFSLAMLETLIQLQAEFKQMTVLLIGDSTLEKMLMQLQGGRLTAHAVTLAPLNSREVRQYLNWRLPFQLSDIELSNLANSTGGNLGALEQEAQKQELQHLEKSQQPERGLLSGLVVSSGVRNMLLTVLILFGGAAAVNFFFQEEFADLAVRANTFLVSKFAELPDELPTVFAHFKSPDIKPVENTLPADLPIRSNEAWVERQINFLNQDNNT